jgi:hypothetical protein
MSVVNGYGHRGKGDVWRATRSSCVHRSPAWKGCCMILWLQLTRTSCIHSGLV